MTEEIKTEISTDCSYYKDVVKEEIIIDGGRMAGITTLKNEITRLEQERDESKENYKEDHAELLMARSEIESLKSNLEEFARRADFAGKENDKLKQENKEFSFIIEKCLENAGIECDDEEQALRSLPILGNAHYKVLVEKEALEQENAELKKACEKCKLFDIEKTNRDLLERIDKLEQENKELKDNNNHLQVIIDDGRAENKRFREENKKLKKDVQLFKCLDTFGESECHCACRCLGNEFCEDADKKINNYRSALEKINRIVKLAHKVEDYLLGRDYTDLVDRIEKEINEVLNHSEE